MPRPREFKNDADRQAAYRARTFSQRAPTQKFLAGLAEGVHRDLAAAIRKGASPLPVELLGAHAGETLENLRDYIEYGSLEAARLARRGPDAPPDPPQEQIPRPE